MNCEQVFKIKNVLIIFFLLIIAGCSVKWAEKMANKGYMEERNDNNKAMRIYNRGIAWNKNCAELFWRRGNLHHSNGMNELAIVDLSKSIEIDSLFNGGYAYWHRAYVKTEIGDTIGALADYDKAILISPEQENFYYYRAVLKLQIGDHFGALRDLDSAISLWNEFSHARFYRSSLKVYLKDYKGAMEDYSYYNFSEEEEKDPNIAWQFAFRGIAKINVNDTIGACLDWRIAANNNDSIAIAKLKEYCK